MEKIVTLRFENRDAAGIGETEDTLKLRVSREAVPNPRNEHGHGLA